MSFVLAALVLAFVGLVVVLLVARMVGAVAVAVVLMLVLVLVFPDLLMEIDQRLSLMMMT